MQQFASDFSRRIDLEGVGPAPRPVDIDQKQTGFKTLKSLRIYRFQPGPPILGESEVDEVFILPLTGEIQMAIFGRDAFQGQIGMSDAIREQIMERTGPCVIHAKKASVVGRKIKCTRRVEACFGFFPRPSLFSGCQAPLVKRPSVPISNHKFPVIRTECHR